MGNRQSTDAGDVLLTGAQPTANGGSSGSTTPRGASKTTQLSGTPPADPTQLKAIKDQIRRSLRKYLGGRQAKIESLSEVEFQTGLQISEDVGLRRLSNTPIGHRLYKVAGCVF